MKYLDAGKMAIAPFVVFSMIGCSGSDDADSRQQAAELSPSDCPSDASWGNIAGEWEAEVVVIVNEYRAAGAECGGESFESAGALEMESVLQCAARLHSKDMADRDFFDHDNPDGFSPWDRIEMLEFDGFANGENISGGQGSPQAVVDGWMDSPGHCANIMNPDTTHIGVGYYAGGQWGHLWTQTFGLAN